MWAPRWTLWALGLLSRPRCWPLGLGSRQRACHLPGARAGAGAQSLTCGPPLGRHCVGPSCPQRWGAFPPRGEHGTEGPAQTTAGEGAEPGVRAASPPGLPSLSPTCTPRAGGPACWVGPPPPAAEVGQKPATPVPSALRLVPSQAVGPSGAAAVASLGALDLQTPPLCSTGRGHPRPQTHGAPLPTASGLRPPR